jgi:hypothetical protein
MAWKTYKGKYPVKKPEKYNGDVNSVIYRSHWEKLCFKYCEDNNDIKAWNSEGVIIPYICATDRRRHKYHMDLCIEYTDGTIVLVEIKPDKQTRMPKVPKRKTKKYLAECMAYAKNESKWNAAVAFAKKNNVKFEIWTEFTLKSKGIKLLTS